MKEDDLVLCVVERVTNTVTFVRLPDGREGTIISSEIAPGRIKFMRQYVFPNKRIVCKVLKVTPGHIHLSLRRVNARERNEVLQKSKQEQAFVVALKQIFGEDAESIHQKILKDYDNLGSFVTSVRDDSSLLSSYVPSSKIESLKKIVDKRRKLYEMKRIVELSCLKEDGMTRIQKVLSLDDKELSLSYLSAGSFSLKLTVEDFKQGKKKLSDIEEEIQKRAKKEQCELRIREE